ncbi:fibroblast growth factor-binding protein 1 [Bombina bombina]|uniref:fibroblast growth factor-binding protein 1 n=1 Tax=Bombina bombina TaxID=8345 RepID=UPI00235A4C2A|nr:fibroblast growth factor-binding protein 1 [Bombina bombina]
MKFKNVMFVSVLILLASHMLLVECNNQREGKKDKEGAGNTKQRGAAKGEKKQAAANPKEKENKPKGGKSSLQGKFATKDKSECIWSVTQTETVILNVECTKGESKISCTFGGNPASCAKYTENQKNYWKQITRALRKQKNICQDPKAILKSKECRKGPPDAHLSLISSGQSASEDTGRNHGELKPTPNVNADKTTTECKEDPDVAENKRAALEYCGDSWSSFCNFFFSMVQSKSC